jgi:uncharacterized protein
MRIWIDCTNSPHVVIFRPLVAEMRRRGHEVTITARDFAQTVGLLERFEMPYTLIGRHRGRNIGNKILGVWSRGRALARWARETGASRRPESARADANDGPTSGKPFDLAVSHGSNDLPLAARLLGIPHVTMFDYEHAALMHHFNIRMSARVIVPEYIEASSLARYGLRPGQLSRYPGLKEEYYLADFEPDEAVLAALDLDPAEVIVTLRTPPSLAAYHRVDNPLFRQILGYLAGRDDVQQVILPRTAAQRAELVGMGLPNARIPERTIDAQSLVHFSDLVVSAGGTINREAVALGTPAFTIFEGRMGAVDLALMAEGRLSRIERPGDLPLVKKGPTAQRIRRDPAAWVDLILAPPVLP